MPSNTPDQWAHDPHLGMLGWLGAGQQPVAPPVALPVVVPVEAVSVPVALPPQPMKHDPSREKEAARTRI